MARTPSRKKLPSLELTKHLGKLGLSLDAPSEPHSLEEAVTLIGRIHKGIESVEDFRLKLKWCMGVVINNTARPYGSNLIETLSVRLSDTYNISASKSTLYECEKLYHVFNGDIARFEKWIQETKIRLGRPVTWGIVQKECLGGRSNPEVIGQEAADQRDFAEAERGVEALERIMMRAREGDEEANGVLEGVRQSLAGLLLLPETKPRIPRSEDYLVYVRSHPCIVCRQTAEAHHAFGRQGVGSKASDFTCVPLCHRHHSEFHFSGKESFERSHHINLVEVAFNLLHRYATGTWASMVLKHGPIQ